MKTFRWILLSCFVIAKTVRFVSWTATKSFRDRAKMRVARDIVGHSAHRVIHLELLIKKFFTEGHALFLLHYVCSFVDLKFMLIRVASETVFGSEKQHTQILVNRFVNAKGVSHSLCGCPALGVRTFSRSRNSSNVVSLIWGILSIRYGNMQVNTSNVMSLIMKQV